MPEKDAARFSAVMLRIKCALRVCLVLSKSNTYIHLSWSTQYKTCCFVQYIRVINNTSQILFQVLGVNKQLLPTEIRDISPGGNIYWVHIHVDHQGNEDSSSSTRSQVFAACTGSPRHCPWDFLQLGIYRILQDWLCRICGWVYPYFSILLLEGLRSRHGWLFSKSLVCALYFWKNENVSDKSAGMCGNMGIVPADYGVGPAGHPHIWWLLVWIYNILVFGYVLLWLSHFDWDVGRLLFKPRLPSSVS